MPDAEHQPKSLTGSRSGRFCPRCGYALRGLPEAGPCPECGVAYTPATVWHQQEPPPIGRMIAIIGLPLWCALATIASGILGLLPMFTQVGLVSTFCFAVIWIFLAPILMRHCSKKYLPPDEVRWGVLRNAARISPILLVVLIFSYAVSIFAAVAVVVVGIVWAICASSGFP